MIHLEFFLTILSALRLLNVIHGVLQNACPIKSAIHVRYNIPYNLPRFDDAIFHIQRRLNVFLNYRLSASDVHELRFTLYLILQDLSNIL